MTHSSPHDRRAADSLLDALDTARLAERMQTQFYRALAASAEEAGDPGTAERLNGLHADEQHHLSRLTARLLELGRTASGPEPVPAGVELEGWEAIARRRERAEVERYERLLLDDLDPRTREMIEQFLEAERRHEAELGGKWMSA
jgi:rubrerythrin